MALRILQRKTTLKVNGKRMVETVFSAPGTEEKGQSKHICYGVESHEPYRSFHLLITVVSQWESEAIKISKTFKIL